MLTQDHNKVDYSKCLRRMEDYQLKTSRRTRVIQMISTEIVENMKEEGRSERQGTSRIGKETILY